MAISRAKTWVAGEVLTAADQNAEFDNIINNALSLVSPLTGALAAGGNDITGLDELAFNDAAANASATGRIRRNAATFTFHDGTAARTFALLQTAQTVSGVKTHTATVEWGKGADIASASALSLGTDGNFFDVTGTTTITSISTKPAGTVIYLQFDGALTLTQNATSLILLGATNYATGAGDVFAFISEGGGNWRELWRRPVANAVSTRFLSGVGTWLTPSSGSTVTRDGAQVLSSETTTSTTYTALATSGPAVTLSPGSTTTHQIWVIAEMSGSVVDNVFVSVTIGGASASDDNAANNSDTRVVTAGTTIEAASQTDGATHTAQYRVGSGTGTFLRRKIYAQAIT